jgi:hypothetical protein
MNRARLGMQSQIALFDAGLKAYENEATRGGALVQETERIAAEESNLWAARRLQTATTAGSNPD